MLIAIEGNIGAGKSFLIQKLKEKYGQEVIFISEDEDIFSKKNSLEKSAIEIYNNNIKKHAFGFQLVALSSKFYAQKEADYFIKKDYHVVMERSMITNIEVFEKLLVSKGFLTEEEKIFTKLIQENLRENLENSEYLALEDIHYVVLNPGVEVCINSVKERGDNIDPEYIRELQKYYDEWAPKFQHFGGGRKECLDYCIKLIDQYLN